MVVRDRLAELQENAKHIKPSDLEEGETTPLKQKDKKMSASQIDFLEALQELHEDIEQVKKNVADIGILHKKILKDVKSDPKIKEELDDKSHSNKKLFERINKKLKEEQAKVDSKKSQIKSPSSREEEDIKIRQNQINSQRIRFRDLWNEYLICQNQYREDTKKQFIRQCQITGTQKTNQEIEELLDNDPSGALEMFSGSILQDTQAAKDKLLAVQERHGEFMKLEKQLEELRDMFMDLGAMVQQQGEMVDNIFHNVNNAEVNVEQGTKNLDKAKKLAIRNRKMKMICGSILFVVILIIFLVLLYEIGAFSYSSPPVIYLSSTTTTTAPRTSVIPP